MKTEQKSKHGGAREGAGRKPRLQYEARTLFYGAVDARWDSILEKLDKLIAGGDFQTLRWVLEQRIGRAAQSINMDLKMQSEPAEISPRIKELADKLNEVETGYWHGKPLPSDFDAPSSD